MQELNSRNECKTGAFRPLPGRFSKSYKVTPPTKFVATQLVCGLKELYAELQNKKISGADTKGDKNELNSFTLQAKKLAGRYKVLQLIGQGQSSILIAAEDLYHFSKKVVAIKIMNLDYTSLGIQEADCLLQLNRADPLNVFRIVRLKNKFMFQDHFCMVFELLRPRPLHQYFKDSFFESEAEKLEKIKEVAVQVLEVLGFLKRENVIHADLKPENILLDSGRRINVKVIDFGNAIRWVHCEMSLYYDNFELQTLLYRAPEVIFGVPFGPEIDMWSLGCILAELYVGKPIFFGKNKTEVLREITATLGPLPRIPYQSGKFYSEFSRFLTPKPDREGASTEMQLMRKLRNTTNYYFANFLVGLLDYNPNHRFTPLQAIRHPFLADHVPFGRFLPDTVEETQVYSDNPSRSGILLNSSKYAHRPQVDDDIRRQQLFGIDLLHVGTRAGQHMLHLQPIGRVLPLVAVNTPSSPEDLCTQRKRIPLAAERHSSSKRIKLNSLKRDKDCKEETSKSRRTLRVKLENSEPSQRTIDRTFVDDVLLL